MYDDIRDANETPESAFTIDGSRNLLFLDTRFEHGQADGGISISAASGGLLVQYLASALSVNERWEFSQTLRIM